MKSSLSFSEVKFRALFRAAIFSQLLQLLLMISDALIAGNIVGEQGISGIHVVMPTYTLTYFIAGLIATGTATLYAREMGQFREKHASQIFTQSFLLSLLFGLSLFLLMVFGKDLYLTGLGLSEAVRAKAESYWLYEKYVVLLTPAVYLLTLMVFADGDEEVSSAVNVLSALSQIVFSVFFTLRMGTGGTSLGTLLAQLVSLPVLLLHFFRKSNSLRFIPHFSWRDLRETFSLSLVDSIWTLCFTVLSLILNQFIINNYSDAYLPLATLVLDLVTLLLSFDAIGTAMSPLVEVYLGEGNYAAEKALANHCLRLAVILGIGTGGLLLASAPLLPRLYDITTPELLPHCYRAVRLTVLITPLTSVKYLLTSQYLFVRKIRLSVMIVINSTLLFPVLFLLLLGKTAGLDNMWWALLISEVLSLAAVMLYIGRRYGREKLPWLLPMEKQVPVMNRSAYVQPEDILSLRDQAERFLKDNAVDRKNINCIMLLIEECGTVIYQSNPKNRIVMECSLLLEKDRIRMYLRDTGCIFDMTDADNPVESIASYLVSNLMNTFSDKRYLTTVSYNRSMFDFPRET